MKSKIIVVLILFIVTLTSLNSVLYKRLINYRQYSDAMILQKTEMERMYSEFVKTNFDKDWATLNEDPISSRSNATVIAIVLRNTYCSTCLETLVNRLITNKIYNFIFLTDRIGKEKLTNWAKVNQCSSSIFVVENEVTFLNPITIVIRKGSSSLCFPVPKGTEKFMVSQISEIILD